MDLWYHEEFNGKMNYFVKIESSGRNRDNPKFMSLEIFIINVPDEEILIHSLTALGLNENSFTYNSTQIGWFDRIILTKNQRTFTGNTDPPSCRCKCLQGKTNRYRNGMQSITFPT